LWSGIVRYRRKNRPFVDIGSGRCCARPAFAPECDGDQSSADADSTSVVGATGAYRTTASNRSIRNRSPG
jgi:hypothetical protein